jgi:transcriptional regulator with XRE-family HTH domain
VNSHVVKLGPTRKERQLLAARLRVAREAAGLTQAELGERLSKPQTFISKIELGERSISLLEAKKICEILDIEITSLLDQEIDGSQ